MTQMPVEDRTLEGYEPPRVVQFNVFLDNRVGKLLELVELLESRTVQIVGLSIMDSVDYAVIRVICGRHESARRLLQEHKLPFSEEDVLAVELGPGRTLATLCRALVGAEVNIHYAYPLTVQPRRHPAIALHTDEPTLTGQVLHRKGFTLLGEADLSPAPGDRGSPGDLEK